MLVCCARGTLHGNASVRGGAPGGTDEGGRASQAQGSTERARLATGGRATDPTMEQGLEAPASTRTERRETAGKERRRRKGEKARFAVNAEAGDSRCGDAGPREAGIRSGNPSLSAEGKLRRAAGASRGIPFRDGRKRGEPQDRQRPAIRSRGRGGTNRRGGEKPRGRRADGKRLSHSEGSARSGGDAEAGRARESYSAIRTMEGRSLDNPMRGNPALRLGRKDREVS
jgi:hypothetical protein